MTKPSFFRGIDWLTEIAQIGNILGFLGRGGHADLGCTAEVFQNLAPTAFLFGRTTVTLVYDDQVKEIRGE